MCAFRTVARKAATAFARPLLAGWGRGAAPQLLNRSVGAPIAAGTAIYWRLPRQRADPVGGVRLAGPRLNAWPHVLRRGSSISHGWLRDSPPQ